MKLHWISFLGKGCAEKKTNFSKIHQINAFNFCFSRLQDNLEAWENFEKEKMIVVEDIARAEVEYKSINKVKETMKIFSWGK